ncbi:MAG: hypothetical protein K2X06_03720 [Burkholderiales bacterium]|nr:hypothetical protein [Burkholderiales bacterium]
MNHLLVHVAGWFQGASRVEHARHLGDRTAPNQWNNVFIPGHGMASGDPSAPGIRWLLKEIQDARQLTVKN